MTTKKADNHPKSAAEASSAPPITVGAGQTATVTAVVSGGQVAQITTEKMEYKPKLVIDYHPGPGARYTINEDPRYIIEPAPGRFWSLGLNGWIILGFPEGVPAGPDYRLFLKEVGANEEFVDFYIAQYIDLQAPATHEPPSTDPNRPSHPINGVFGNAPIPSPGPYHHREATPEQTQPGPSWPSWIPRDRWLYLGWIRGKKESTELAKLTLSNIPYGQYYYLLLHDRHLAGSAADTTSPDGADIESVIIKYDYDNRILRIILIIDNSRSAISLIDKYKKTVQGIINTLPIGGRQAWISVRFIEDLDPQGTITTARAEESIKTKRHSFSQTGGNNVYWKQVTHDNKEEIVKDINKHITMDKLTSPILSALLAVEKEEIAEIKRQLDRPSSSTTKVRMILITDGLPDPYNDYVTPEDITSEQQINSIKASLRGNIKKKLEDFKAYLRPEDRQLLGHHEPNGTWLRDIWRKELGGVISALSLETAEGAPANMHAIPHTDCLNGSRGIGSRIGVNEPRRAAHPPPPPYESIPKSWQR